MKSILFIILSIGSLLLLNCSSKSKTKNTNKSTEKLNLEILPTPRTSVLQEDGYIVWGASMVQDKNGLNHLYYCRWKGTLADWYKSSEIVHAISENPLGPYIPKEVVLGREPEGEELWYGISSYNPCVVEFDGKFYMYYTGSNGSNFPIKMKDGSFKTSPGGTLITQLIGVAVADNPAGPWERMKEPLIDISDQGFDSQLTCNPAVTRDDKGNYLMVYKCSGGNESGIFLTVATSDSPIGPFVKSGKKIFVHPDTKFAVEDPFLWFQNGKYQCIVDDQDGFFSGQKCLIRFESSDGINWVKADPFVFSFLEIQWSDGELEKTENLERPQIWFKNGKPAILFTAVWKDNKGFNVHMPLQKNIGNVSSKN